MPQHYPGEIDNSNPNFAMLDSTFVRGGGRRVADTTALYALTVCIDQLKEQITEVFVDSLDYKMRLTDINNVGNSGGWTPAGSLVTTDATPTSGSSNPVQSGGVYTALLSKLDTSNPVFTGVLSGGNLGLTSTQYLLFNGNSDTNWRIGYNIGTFTYSNVSTPLTIVVGTGSTDGFAIGGPSGSSFFEIKGSTGDSFFTGNISALNLSGVNTGDQTLSSLGAQAALSGTGFVKISGTTISYDNSSYLHTNATTSALTEGTNLYFTEPRVLATVLSGYVSGAGAISSSDSILSSIQKLDGNIQSIVSGVSSVFGRTGVVLAQSGDYDTSLVPENGNLYYTSARFNTAFSSKSTSDLSEGTNLYFTNSRAINSTLTSYTSSTGTISSSDTILSAIQKLNGNIGLLSGSIVYQGTWDASTNTPALASGVGTKGYLYKVSVAGSTNLDGITQWNIGDQVVFNGTTWDKIDGISSEVVTVFGRVGNVVAVSGDYTTDQVTEGTNLYFTNLRAQSAISLTTTGDSGAATYTSGTLNIPNYTLSGLGGVPSTRTINGKALSSDITLVLASSDFANQGTTTQVLYGNGSGSPSWGAVVAPSGTLTGTTLASNVVSSSLTSVGVLTGLTVSTSSTTTPRGIVSYQTSSDSLGSRITMYKSRNGGSIITGDVLGSWTAGGYDGTSYIDSAKIIVTSIGTISTGTIAATMGFQTMNSAGTLVTAVTIDQTQVVTFTNPTKITGGTSSQFQKADGSLDSTSYLSGVVGASNGGTGQSSYTVGDLLYASASTTLSKLNGVSTGNVLISGGVNTAPSWGKVGLTTHISGILGVTNGGTGTGTSFTQGSVVISGTSGVYVEDHNNLYYSTSIPGLSVAVAGDFTGTNSVNIYGQYDAYMPQSSIGTITSGSTLPGITASTSRGTGSSPTINNAGDLIGSHSFWAYTGSSPAYTYMSGMAGSVTGSSSSNLGGQLDFYTKADGGSLVDRLTIDNAGIVTLLGSGSSTSLLLKTTSDSNYATFSRSTTSNSLSAINTVLQQGGIGNAVVFNGTTQYFTGDDANHPTGTSINLTVACWIKGPLAVPGTLYAYGTDGSGNPGLRIDFTAPSNAHFYIYNGTTQIASSLGTTILTSTWNHYAIVISGSSVSAYVNGTLSASSTLSAYNITSLAGSTGVTNKPTGAANPNSTYDQLLVYNSALTGANILTLYASGAGTSTLPTTTGLIRQFNFDEGSGSTVADSNPNVTQKSLTLVNYSTSMWVGLGNGLVPTSNTTTTTNWIKVADGINANERGQVILGDTQSGTRLQGYTIKHFVNNTVPFIQTNDGNVLFTPGNTSETVKSLSAIGATNLAIGTYATSTAAPSNGLIVSGTSGFGTSAPSSTYIADFTGQTRFNGIANDYGSVPEHRWVTSADSAFARFQRTTASSNNLFIGRNQVLQVGGIGKAMNFINNSYATAADTGIATGSPSFSISVFFKAFGTPSGNYFPFFILGTTGSSGMAICISTSNTIAVINLSGTLIGSGPSITLNQWNHLVFTVSGTSAIFYLNNTSTSITLSQSISIALAGTFQIGGNTPCNTTVALDQFLYYPFVLSSSNVSTIYHSGAGTATPTSGATRRYEFEEGVGTSVADINSVGTQYNLTTFNSPVWNNVGIVPISGVSSEATFFSVSDGLVNAEKGVATWGDFNGRNQQQGKWFQFFQGNLYPLVSNNAGQWVFNASNTSAAVPTIGSTIDINGNLTIGSTYAGTSAPTDGLIVQGRSSFGATAPSGTSFMTLSGNVTAVSSLGVGLLINTIFKQASDTDILTAIDVTGITSTNTTGNGGKVMSTVSLTSGGSGYTNGTYNVVAVTGGTGSGAFVNVTVSGGAVTAVSVSNGATGGNNYTVGDVCSVSAANIGGTGSGFTFTVTGCVYLTATPVGIRTNSMVPSANNTGSLGAATLLYSAAYITTVNGTGTRATAGTYSFANSAGTPAGSFINGTSNWIFSSSTTETNYRVAMGAGSLGSMLANGTITAASNIARGVYFNNTLNAAANNDALVALDINPTFGLGTTVIQTLGSITGGSGYTNGTFNGTALTGGSGTGATANITVSGNVVTVVTLVNRGTGYTVGNTLSASLAGGSGFSIPVASVGLTGLSPLALRTTGDVQFIGNINLPTAGNKLNIATGTNASIGTATLSSGTVTVNTTAVTSSSKIFFEVTSSIGTTIGRLAKGTVTAGTSFVVNSYTSANTLETNDNSIFDWWIVN